MEVHDERNYHQKFFDHREKTGLAIPKGDHFVPDYAYIKRSFLFNPRLKKFNRAIDLDREIDVKKLIREEKGDEVLKGQLCLLEKFRASLP
jgi:hypothetical protein